MKVNTDGVLLGALMTLSAGDRALLDIGTGTGAIALMAAQRLNDLRALSRAQQRTAIETVTRAARQTASLTASRDANPPKPFNITGIDIDALSAAEAGDNFKNSPWAGLLTARHISLQDYDAELAVSANRAPAFDAIFSNPPYFESSLKAPDPRRRAARHADNLSYREIISFASRRLAPSGRLSIILPSDTEIPAIRLAASFGLVPGRRVRIRAVPSRPPFRVILEFTPDTLARTSETREQFPQYQSAGARSTSVPPMNATAEEELTILDAGTHTDSYRALVRDFLYI